MARDAWFPGTRAIGRLGSHLEVCQQVPRESEYLKSNGGIDVKINGYISSWHALRLEDIDRTIRHLNRCDRDSVQPSNAAGGTTTIGTSRLPERFKANLDLKSCFAHTEYNFPKLLDVCEALAREYVVREGGWIETDANGEENFVIPVKRPEPSPLVFSWDPEPIAKSLFTEEEMARIRHQASADLQKVLDKLFPETDHRLLRIRYTAGLREQDKGKERMSCNSPIGKCCVLTMERDIPTGKENGSKTCVTHHDGGDWSALSPCQRFVQEDVMWKKSGGEDGLAGVDFNLTPLREEHQG